MDLGPIPEAGDSRGQRTLRRLARASLLLARLSHSSAMPSLLMKISGKTAHRAIMSRGVNFLEPLPSPWHQFALNLRERSSGKASESTEGVLHVVEDVAPGRDTEGRAESTQRQVLTSRLDACYFSFVTITTLGYGDYVPATQLARLIVMWQVGAGVLLVVVGFPLAVSRLATVAERE